MLFPNLPPEEPKDNNVLLIANRVFEGMVMMMMIDADDTRPTEWSKLMLKCLQPKRDQRCCQNV